MENNRLIAEFLGYTKPHPKFKSSTYWYKEGQPPLAILLFDTDWNWLMEVVDKIYEMDLYYDKYIDYNSSMFSNGQITLGTRIDRVYEQVVEFIKWYNENN